MAYDKRNIPNGHKLTAEDLAHLETGIAGAYGYVDEQVGAIDVGVTSVNGMTGDVMVSGDGGTTDLTGYATETYVNDAVAAVDTMTDAEIGALVQDDTTATGVALSGRLEPYATRPTSLIDSLPSPFYVSHRGGPDEAPEGTLEAYRINDATGVHVLEADLNRTGDGALVVMHDTTVDRTTDGTGNVSGYTLPGFLALNAADHLPWPHKVPPATLKQFLAEFGHKRVLQIEPKDPADLAALLDAAEAEGVLHNLQIETNGMGNATTALDRGAQVWFYFGLTVDDTLLANAVAAGVQQFAFSEGMSDASIAKLVNTGKPVTMYTTRRRFDRDRVRALGVQGFSSDVPNYIAKNAAMTARDSWRYGVRGQGLLSNKGGNLPSVVDGALILNRNTANNYEYVQPGEMMPIPQAVGNWEGAGNYTIDVDMGWQKVPTSTMQAIQVVFGIPDDRNYIYGGTTDPRSYPNAWNCHFRANGYLQLYKMNSYNPVGPVNATSTNVGTTLDTGPDLVAGEFAHIRITVTPTQITIARTDIATPQSYTHTDSANRGGYFMLGNFSDDGVGMFKNLVIS